MSDERVLLIVEVPVPATQRHVALDLLVQRSVARVAVHELRVVANDFAPRVADRAVAAGAGGRVVRGLTREARRAIQQNAVSVNKSKVTAAEQPLSDFALLQNKFLLISKGKKNHLITVI